MFNTSSAEASLPTSSETYREAYARGSQHCLKAFRPPISSSPKCSKSHLARSRSSSSVEAAQDQPSTSSPLSSLAELPPAHPRSDSLGKGLNATSSPSEPQCPGLQKFSIDAVGEKAYADFLPPGFEVLPKCCYNYQSYEPPPPPAVLRWSRKIFVSLIVSTCPSVFLSCNLINPVHLASIIAPGCKWSVIEEIAEYMTPAVNYDFVETNNGNAWKSVQGVLVFGMLPEARGTLEEVMTRRHKEGYRRCVEDVMVEVEDGDEIEVAAYVYRKA